MARPSIQHHIKKLLSSEIYTSLYALFSGLLLIVMMICWAPITTVVWNFESWLKYIILGNSVWLLCVGASEFPEKLNAKVLK